MEIEILLTKGVLAIPCKLTEPEDGVVRRVVLGVHGLGGSSSDQIQASIAEEMGLFYSATLRFDFPAHGDSPLDSNSFTLQSCMDSLLAAAHFAKDSYPQVEDLCIFATGFGAYITLLCMDELMELPGNIKLVIQTPSVQMHQTLLNMAQMNEETLRLRKQVSFRPYLPLDFSYNFYQDLQSHIALDSYPLPFLILHGEEDAYISMADIQHLRQLNDQAKLVIIPGASHRFMEDGAWDMVVDLTRDWFEWEQVLVTDWE